MLRNVGDYYNEMKQPVKYAHLSVTEDGATSPITYTGDDKVISCKVESVGTFLGTATKKAELRLIGEHSGLVGKKFAVRVGIKREVGDTVDFVTVGVFNVTGIKVNYEKHETTVEMYDAIYRAGGVRYPLNDDVFPISMKGLAAKVAELLGVELSDMSNLPNADHMITDNLYKKISGFTLRNVIDEIAKATGTSARMTGDILQFVPYNNTVVATLTEQNLKKYKVGERFGRINSLVLSRLPQEDNIVQSHEQSVAQNGLCEVKIANNEILDDDRQALIQPLFTAIVAGGNRYLDNIEVTTEGHGVYEVGDIIRISVTADGTTSEAVGFITNIKLDITGGLNEVIQCVTPNKTVTNQGTAGSIWKTIFNTEIKVDKQKQEIEAVVSKQATLESEVRENFTSIRQDLTTITQTVQSTGGSNLIKNSVGYARSRDNKLSEWEHGGAATGVISAVTSPSSVAVGALSGNEIRLSKGARLVQRVVVQNTAEARYSLGFMARKDTIGQAKVILKNSADYREVVLPHGTEYEWTQFKVEGLQPTVGYLDVIIETDNQSVGMAITDLILNTGDRAIKWLQANGEVLNTQVAINKDGMVVRSSVYDGDYTVITPLEFAGYSNASGSVQRVFSLNRDITKVQNLEASRQITMPPIKIVPIMEGVRAGWSFVKTGGNE